MNFDLIAKKSAEELEKLARFEKAKQFAIASIPTLSALLGTTALFSGVGYYRAKKNLEEQRERLQDSHSALVGHEPFKKEPATFDQRFHELSTIAPAIASNPHLAKKVIEPRLEKGFDLDDIHRLSSIEYHSGHAPKLPAPSSVAKNQAIVGLGRALNYILPMIPVQQSMSAMAKHIPGRAVPQKPLTEAEAALLTNLDKHMDALDPIRATQEFGEDYHHEMAAAKTPEERQRIDAQYLEELHSIGKEFNNFVRAAGPALSEHGTQEQNQKFHDWLRSNQAAIKNKKVTFSNLEGIKNFKKEGSAMSEQKVSEECLGKMLAETHIMCKEAGLLGGAGRSAADALSHSGNNLLNYAKLMSVPMALAAGMGLIRAYGDAKKKAELHAQADRVFAGLKRTSETVQSNPEIAGQAFDALKSFAPALAAKPIIAKTFIENVVNGQGNLDPNTANMLATTQQTIQGIEKQTGFISGLKEPMSLFQFKAPGHGKNK